MENYTPKSPLLYDGNKVVINSDRLIFNAKTDSILLFSNEVIGFSTNGSFHFDTSDDNESKFIINAPNIYLGLDLKKLPTEPAVLGNELHDLLHKILDTIYRLTADIEYKVSYIVTAPGGPTGLNPANAGALFETRQRIKKLVGQIEAIKSDITKIA